MNILGITAILVLPYMAGYILRFIFNSKETSQIETYLIGFFFLFFLNGTSLAIAIRQNATIGDMTFMIKAIEIIIAVASVVVFVMGRMMGRGKPYKYTLEPEWKNEEKIMLLIVCLLAGIIALRIVLLASYVRDDEYLGMIKTILNTDTLFKYNPITSQISDMGVIGSKKIITLPIYYTCLIRIYGFAPVDFLYILLTMQTVACIFFVSVILARPILKSRKKLLTYILFVGCVILSGDYFSGAICKKILWNGYAGDTIVASVMLTYILFVLTRWYRQERGDDLLTKPDEEQVTSIGKAGWYNRFLNLLRILLCTLASLTMTRVASGVLLIIIVIGVGSVACTLRFGKEEL
ncbi:MAG: hypothetical protein K5662_01560 [Lachnospiraceae bacterium]|nr:hypothetical protein [Lachnospiraceae bacterium]